MSKRNKGGKVRKGKAVPAPTKGKATHGKALDRRDTAPVKSRGKAKADTAERKAEVAAAEERYAEMRSRDRTARQIRAVAVARGDDGLIELCDEIIAGTREEPVPAPSAEPEASPAEVCYVELRTQGKTAKQVRALAESRNDHDLFEFSDEIIRGTREEPEGEYPDVTDDSGESEGDADNAGGGDAPAEADARPMVSVEELRSIDLELTGLVNRFREAAGEMNHLRGVLVELQRTRKAMGRLRGHRARRANRARRAGSA